MSEPTISTMINVIDGQITFFGIECTVLVDNLNGDWLFSGPIRPPE